jgi:hypothetical protein
MCTLVLATVGCSSAEVTYVEEGGTYTAVSVEELVQTVELPSFAGERAEDIIDMRSDQLTALRAEGGGAAELATILTSNFPTDTASVPYYAEEAVVDGQEAWVVLEVWGSEGGTLDKRRLWVLKREDGAIIMSSVFN